MWHHNNSHMIHPTTHKQCSTLPSIVLCSAPNIPVVMTPPSPDQPHPQPHGHFHALVVLELFLRTPCFAVLMSPSSPARFDAPVCSLVHFIALTPWVTTPPECAHHNTSWPKAAQQAKHTPTQMVELVTRFHVGCVCASHMSCTATAPRC